MRVRGAIEFLQEIRAGLGSTDRLTRIQKLRIAAVALIASALLVKYVVAPKITKFAVRRKIALKPGWQMRAVWAKFPFAMIDHCYLFNVTNPEGVANGETPVVKEVGPFVYEKWHEKTNMQDHEEDDTVSYTAKYTYYYDKERSGSLTGDEEIIFPNLFALILIEIVARTDPTTMPLINKAINSIFKKPESLFARVRVRDVLFDGLPIDCNVSDTAGTAVCNQIQKNHDEYNMRRLSDTMFSFSIFGSMNATDSKQRSRVYRGLGNIQDVGRVTEYAGKRDIGVWGDRYCDRFRGTDGTVFPPYYDPRGRDSIVVYVPSFCREVSMVYEAPSKLKGIKTLRYRTVVGPDWRQDPRAKCYSCEKGNDGGEDSCLPRGVYDLYRCIKAPLVLTNPHFYDVDEHYASRVEGLQPEKERHTIFAEQDPFTGGILIAYIRFQLNMFLRPVQKIKLAKNFPEALLPLFWVDEHIVVPKWLRREVRMAHFALKSVKVIVHLMIVGGLGLLAYTFYQDYRTTKFSAKKVTSITSSQKSSPMEVKTMFGSHQKKTQELAVSFQKPTFVLPTPMK